MTPERTPAWDRWPGRLLGGEDQLFTDSRQETLVRRGDKETALLHPGECIVGHPPAPAGYPQVALPRGIGGIAGGKAIADGRKASPPAPESPRLEIERVGVHWLASRWPRIQNVHCVSRKILRPRIDAPIWQRLGATSSFALRCGGGPQSSPDRSRAFCASITAVKRRAARR